MLNNSCGINSDKHLDLLSSNGLREGEERQGKVDEAVLEHFQLIVALNQLHTCNTDQCVIIQLYTLACNKITLKN